MIIIQSSIHSQHPTPHPTSIARNLPRRRKMPLHAAVQIVTSRGGVRAAVAAGSGAVRRSYPDAELESWGGVMRVGRGVVLR